MRTVKRYLLCLEIEQKMNEFVRVSKEEFDSFVKNYPVELQEHWIEFCTPPIITWNDFSSGKQYPDTIVARTYDYSHPIWDEVEKYEEEYYIKTEV